MYQAASAVLLKPRLTPGGSADGTAWRERIVAAGAVKKQF
jgi:hypothetical protein